MRIGFRADGNTQIGTGHLRRCLAIAEELRLKDITCFFFVADKKSSEFLQGSGFSCICLESDWKKLDGEIITIKQYLLEYRIELLLIDTYFITEVYLKEIHKVCKIAYIDDLFECIYPYDILVNYANYYEKYPYDRNYKENTKLLLGPKYAPLRSQFQSGIKKEVRENVNNILITTGGTDNFNVALRLTKELLQDQSGAYTLTVICGKYSGQFNQLKEFESKFPALSVVYNVDNMAELMGNADLAISASGTTLFELGAMGVPFVCFTLADNQIDNAESFDEKALGLYAGDVRDNLDRTIDNIKYNLQILIKDYSAREKMVRNLQVAIDGKGARRLAAALIESSRNG